MAFRKEELLPEDLQAFDLLINYLRDQGKPLNLGAFMSGELENANNAWDAAKAANRERDKIRDAVNKATAILSEVFEGIDPDHITLGQLNQEISLERLMEIRQNLERKDLTKRVTALEAENAALRERLNLPPKES